MTPIRGLYHEPCGVDFSTALARGLRARLGEAGPEALARCTILVNTHRMAARAAAAFALHGATLLPRIGLVQDVAALLPPGAPLAEATPPLALRLRLTVLVRKLLEARPGLSPPASAFDLAGSLQGLLDEMVEEGVDADALERIDVGHLSQHWQDALAFLRIATGWRAGDDATTPAMVQDAALARLGRHWAETPPADPVIVAGSTASRGGTRALMRLVCGLPQGAVILPGLDADMPDAVWADLLDPEAHRPAGAQDHPQYRHAALLAGMGLTRADCPRWDDAAPASAARNRLLSLALRPAPATDAWREEGPALRGVAEACAGITLLEAPGPAEEAAAIALGLRAALEDGRRAALITPDRTLSRQVAAQLDRWGIVPDDSAGKPLNQSAPGRLLQHLAHLTARPIESEGLVTLLKHPLAHSNDARLAHLEALRRMEVDLLRGNHPDLKPCAFPDRAAVEAWLIATDRAPDAWTDWLIDLLYALATMPVAAPLADHVAAHLDLAQLLARGSALGGADPGTRPTGRLWDGPAGREALRVMQTLARDAPEDGATAISAPEYARILSALLSAEEVRDPYSPHPQVMIWGALEARARTADLVILGGLVDGIWPAHPDPDPWLSRQMRAAAGLRLPDRAIGLSAHDFQQAAAGPEIWLSRATRDAETETVPSRWLNRVTGLLDGIGPEGAAALDAMRERGRHWSALATAMGAPAPRHEAPRAPRPAPCPPPGTLEPRLSVTAVERLIRDPYAIYASRGLRLFPLPPLRPGPDARLRGDVVHRALERFTLAHPGALPEDAGARLRDLLEEVLGEEAPWPAHRRLWLGRFARVLPDFLAQEAARRAEGRPALTEGKGTLILQHPPFTLTAIADRMDLTEGGVAIYDYKTGAAPSKKQQDAFAKQLLLEALMVEAGAFPDLGPRPVAKVAYLSLGGSYKEEARAIDPDLLAETREGLSALLSRYWVENAPFPARLAPETLRYAGDYDHLSRKGEWDDTRPATPIPVGR